MHVLRHETVSEPRVPAHPSLKVNDAVLFGLEARILAQDFDNPQRIGPSLQFVENQRLVLMRPVDRGLTRGHAFPGHHHRLHVFQKVIGIARACR